MMAPQAIKRSGTIIEAAEAILWLSPDRTCFVTGIARPGEPGATAFAGQLRASCGRAIRVLRRAGTSGWLAGAAHPAGSLTGTMRAGLPRLGMAASGQPRRSAGCAAQFPAQGRRQHGHVGHPAGIGQHGDPQHPVIRIHIADCPGLGITCRFAAVLRTLAVTGSGKPE